MYWLLITGQILFETKLPVHYNNIRIPLIHGNTTGIKVLKGERSKGIVLTQKITVATLEN